jgi:hypothetical protein
MVIANPIYMAPLSNSQADPEQFICDICGAELDSVSDLEEHKEEHLFRGRTRDEEQQEIRRDIGAAGLPGSPLP